MSLPIRQLANDIKGKELQPGRKVAGSTGSNIQLVGPVQKHLEHLVHQAFVLDQPAHGKGTVDAATEAGMECLVGGGEERGDGFAVAEGLLDDVEVGL
jgi:hypothetical protein